MLALLSSLVCEERESCGERRRQENARVKRREGGLYISLESGRKCYNDYRNLTQLAGINKRERESVCVDR